MLRQFELIERLKSYDPSADEDLVNRAYVFTIKTHGSQLRASGAPYYSHPIEVAGLLTELHLDTQSIVTGLLHDTVEDTVATLEEIEELFGPEIARLVDGVTKLSRLELQSESTKQAENFRKLVLAMSSDIRVLLVKLADRLHNMRTLNFIKEEEKRKRIARETLEIYAPLAERMGMQKIKDELEDIAFLHLNPEMYTSIKNRLTFLYNASEETIQAIIDDLKLTTEKMGLVGTITGRLKAPYSIWCKMRNKNVGFEQLSDIMAFRLAVESTAECYQALGVIHSHYLVIPGRFKDYISTPKANNYQSLHTAVIGPLNQRIEIQIRTKEMHKVAEFGVAAHWSYKKGENNVHDGKQYAWLRSLLEILEHAAGPEEFLEHTKLEMFQDQVFCFTPKGELISLPKGATTLDFAYAIHSEVGDHTVGAKVNGKQVPLRTLLENGDQIEILTAKHQTPSPTWERFVITGKARARIRKFMRAQQRQQFSELGKSLLHKACVKDDVPYAEKTLIHILKKFHYFVLDDLFAAIGEGIHSAKEVLHAAYPDHYKKADVSFEKVSEKKKLLRKRSVETHGILGLIPGMAISFPACCHPLPGDDIMGLVTSGKGVTIHMQTCTNVTSVIQTERLIDLAWDMTHPLGKTYNARLKVIFHNKQGSLAATTTAISKSNGNILNLRVMNRSSDFWEILVDVDVAALAHLEQIMASIRQLPIIFSVQRL